jgi:hypothetical protein
MSTTTDAIPLEIELEAAQCRLRKIRGLIKLTRGGVIKRVHSENQPYATDYEVLKSQEYDQQHT